ncbi:MAG TPA: ATP-binding protein [Terriglobia bacterium]|nr:ATP-binding protein [Terriglobia bacterium]
MTARDFRRLLWLVSITLGAVCATALGSCDRRRLAAALVLAVVLPVVSSQPESAKPAYQPLDPVAAARGVLWEAEPSTFRVRSVTGDLQGTLGYPAERWLKDPGFWPGHIAPEDRERVVDACHRALTSGPDNLRLEYQAVGAGGERVGVENSLEIVRDAHGRLSRLRGRMVNLAEQRRVSEVLRQSRKMEEMGRLAGGVAHDFNNLLTVIGGHADLLLAGLDPHDPRRASIEEIRKAGQRAASLTRQLLAFSRRRAASEERLDLNALVESLGSMLRRLIGENIELITVPQPGVGYIFADPGRVEQVILNLVVNARDAMPAGGRVTIETAACEVGGNGVTRAVVPGRYVTLSVTDNGCGMDADTQSRMFEAFFTTKDAGKGTGLGLATVREVVRECGGGIEVESRVGQGSMFRVYFPRAEAVSALVSAPAPAVIVRGGHETILVVEDDENVRAMSRHILKALGYRVLVAASGDEASELLDRQPGPVHLLLADVMMPRLNGPDLAVLLRARRPDLKLLFMSGYTRDAISHYANLRPEMSCVQKPFTSETLGASVRRVLDCAPEPQSQPHARPARLV